jgi:N-acetylglutamate synthase-like GNAT family acetyltransferase
MTPAAALATVTAASRPLTGSGAYLRTGSPEDAPAIHALIIRHLDEGRLLPRELTEIAVHARRFVVVCQNDRIIACAELAPLSRDVSEVRSLVVSEAARRVGVGRELVDELVGRATMAGFEKLCAFTHAPAYFVQLGFSMVPHVWLPEKIVTDCHSCPHFRRCGQYAVMRELRRPNQAFVPLAALHG